VGAHAAKPAKANEKPVRRRLRAADRRAEIVAAAREVFLRSGYTGARIREITALAGVNDALLYQHFDSKEALFEAAIAEPLEATARTLTERGFAMVHDPPDALASPSLRRARIADLLDAVLDMMLEVAPMLAILLLSEPDRAERFYRTRFFPVVEMLADAVEHESRAWEHRDFDARLAVTSALGACLLLALDRRFGGTMLADRDAAVRELTENILQGLELPAETDEAPAGQGS
jgi:AcrR family transcriptional regulator